MNYPLFNVDSALEPLDESEITAEIIEARIAMLSYKNLDFMPKRLPFVLELATHTESYWKKLIALSSRRYWIKQRGTGALVFDPNVDCGFTRVYFFRPKIGIQHQQYDEGLWVNLKDQGSLHSILNTAAAKGVFDAWIRHQDSVLALPTEFVTGRLANTSVEKAMIFSKGDGCVMCGKKATCYAATTMGHSDAALMLQLPVCPEHLSTARAYPTIFQFLVSLFQMGVDWTKVEKLDAIPDGLIPTVHTLTAAELGAAVGEAKPTERGWELWMPLPSGWHWLLRLNTFMDYCYLLFEPGQKNPAYKADSAPHHPELKFFPDHEHSRPNRKSDQRAPSYLYGHPLLDLKRLKTIGIALGAYPSNH